MQPPAAIRSAGDGEAETPVVADATSPDCDRDMVLMWAVGETFGFLNGTAMHPAGSSVLGGDGQHEVLRRPLDALGGPRGHGHG